MSSPVALHGGGEFLTGDEPFLAALLELAAARARSGRSLRVAIVPTAAARGRPDLTAAYGVAAFERVAEGAGLAVEAGAVAVVDAASAADPDLADRLAGADIIHLPGGDPDLIPTLLPGSRAWAAMCAAHEAGAILAGASAGAMALAAWCWTPTGGVPGLGVVGGLLVVPHADEPRWSDALERFGGWAPGGLGAIGLGEQTGAITAAVGGGPAGEADTRRVIRWHIVGPGEVRWLSAPGARTVVARAGETILTGSPGPHGTDPTGRAGHTG